MHLKVHSSATTTRHPFSFSSSVVTDTYVCSCCYSFEITFRRVGSWSTYMRNTVSWWALLLLRKKHGRHVLVYLAPMQQGRARGHLNFGYEYTLRMGFGSEGSAERSGFAILAAVRYHKGFFFCPCCSFCARQHRRGKFIIANIFGYVPYGFLPLVFVYGYKRQNQFRQIVRHPLEPMWLELKKDGRLIPVGNGYLMEFVFLKEVLKFGHLVSSNKQENIYVET